MRYPFAVAFAVLLAGCSRPAMSVDTALSRLKAGPVAQLDSATIDRMCSQPARVHAGLADCVLKDQAEPRRFKPATPLPR